jgi:hypothetical protein
VNQQTIMQVSGDLCQYFKILLLEDIPSQKRHMIMVPIINS